MAFRYLSGDQHPDHATIAEFRKRHPDALSGLFTQALLLCWEAGLVLGHAAIDETKIKANASKHKAMSYTCLVRDPAGSRVRSSQFAAIWTSRYEPNTDLLGESDRLPMSIAFRRKKGLSSRFSRHVHDLVRLQETGHLLEAIAAQDVAGAFAIHKNAFFAEKLRY